MASKIDTPDTWGLEPAGTFKRACYEACHRSAWYGCTVHVQARIGRGPSVGDEPRIVGYTVDDWCDGATVATYTNGREH